MLRGANEGVNRGGVTLVQHETRVKATVVSLHVPAPSQEAHVLLIVLARRGADGEERGGGRGLRRRGSQRDGGGGWKVRSYPTNSAPCLSLHVTIQ